jgi:hypothetical protein
VRTRAELFDERRRHKVEADALRAQVSVLRDQLLQEGGAERWEEEKESLEQDVMVMKQYIKGAKQQALAQEEEVRVLRTNLQTTSVHREGSGEGKGPTEVDGGAEAGGEAAEGANIVVSHMGSGKELQTLVLAVPEAEAVKALESGESAVELVVVGEGEAEWEEEGEGAGVMLSHLHSPPITSHVDLVQELSAQLHELQRAHTELQVEHHGVVGELEVLKDHHNELCCELGLLAGTEESGQGGEGEEQGDTEDDIHRILQERQQEQERQVLAM